MQNSEELASIYDPQLKFLSSSSSEVSHLIPQFVFDIIERREKRFHITIIYSFKAIWFPSWLIVFIHYHCTHTFNKIMALHKPRESVSTTSK